MLNYMFSRSNLKKNYKLKIRQFFAQSINTIAAIFHKLLKTKNGCAELQKFPGNIFLYRNF